MVRRLLFATTLLAFAATGTATAQLSIVQSWSVDQFPGGIAYDMHLDHLWLVNDSTGEVREYDRFGAYIGMFPSSQVNATWPVGIDYEEATQNLWIADEYAPEQVVECTKAGVYVSSFSVDAHTEDAVGIAYVPTDDNLYLADDNANEIVIFTKTGTYVNRWSTAPNGDTDSICFLDGAGTLLVGDDNGATIYEYLLNGTLLGSWNMTAELGIQGVEGLSYDPLTGNVFLGDSTSGARIVYEIAGFDSPTAVVPTTWGAIKAHFE